MKKGLTITIFMLVLALPMLSFGQSIGMGFKMGPMMQTMQFMLPMGSVQPFIGIDFIGIKGNMETPATTATTASETDISASLFIPHAGLKFFLGSGDAKPYLFGNFFKSFASIKAEVDGTSMLGEETEELAKDLLSFWGIKVGFGGEYTISDHFSVGGEWGFHMLNMNATMEQDIGLEQALETEIKAGLKNSYVAFVVNFFF